MNKKRNLSKEINVNGCAENTSNALDISIDRIKHMVSNQIFSASVERKSNTMKSKKENSNYCSSSNTCYGNGFCC